MTPEDEKKNQPTSPSDELPDLDEMELPDFDDPAQQSLMPEPEEKLSFWKRYQEIIVTVVILLAIAAGFYLYARKSNQATDNEPIETAEETSEGAAEDNLEQLQFEEVSDLTGEQPEPTEILDENKLPTADNEQLKDSALGQAPTQTPVVNEIKTPTEQAVVDSEQITTTAASGQGVTHLARQALAEYLKNNPDEKITNEHKIYIEDYLKDRTGSQGLKIGDSLSFKISLIQEAIGAADNLNESQLNNLQKYSQLVFG